MNAAALDLAFDLATRPNFDALHDPNPDTQLIEPYYDPVGLPTQGYGRLLSRTPWEDLGKYPPIPVAQAKANLMADLQRSARGAHGLIKVALTPQQWAAIYDFTFNCGAGNLQVSRLRAVINRNEFDHVQPELSKWVYARSVKLAGLVRRRAAEWRMWRDGV